MNYNFKINEDGIGIFESSGDMSFDQAKEAATQFISDQILSYTARLQRIQLLTEQQFLNMKIKKFMI